MNDKLEKKANLSYLSWAWAWAEVKKIDPNTSAEIHEFPLPGVEGIKVPYLQTPTGYFVKVSVTIKGQTETEWLPVMDHRNKTVEKPSAFDINKTTKRCLVKAIALHGLGLYVYAGEDLPEADATEPNGKQSNYSNHSNATNKPQGSNGSRASEKQMKMIKAKIKNVSKLARGKGYETKDTDVEVTLKKDMQTQLNIDDFDSKMASKAIELLISWENQYSQSA
ncbi:E12 [Bacillus cereus BGSC 6E1]|nr:E12 [Bacillus cereus BGSC 6E1]